MVFICICITSWLSSVVVFCEHTFISSLGSIAGYILSFYTALFYTSQICLDVSEGKLPGFSAT